MWLADQSCGASTSQEKAAQVAEDQIMKDPEHFADVT